MSKMEFIRKSKAGARSKFDPSFKRKVVLEHHHGTGPLYVTAKKYGINRTTLVNWINWYEQDQAQLLTSGSMGAEQSKPAAAGEQQQYDSQPAPLAQDDTALMSADLKSLHEELRLAKVKLACLESLIDITERDLGIDIRKKAGTRSSEA